MMTYQKPAAWIIRERRLVWTRTFRDTALFMLIVHAALTVAFSPSRKR